MDADKKMQGFETLLNETSAALAEMVEAIKAGQSSGDEIAATLADMVVAIEKKSALPIGEIVAAIKAMRITAPAVTHAVTVSPTPIQVLPAPVHIHERPAFNIKSIPTYDRHGAITEILHVRVPVSPSQL